MLRSKATAGEAWCPFARVAIVAGPTSSAAANRFSFQPTPTDQEGGTVVNPGMARCVADECMAWRWASLPPTPPEPRLKHWPRAVPVGEPDENQKYHHEWQEEPPAAIAHWERVDDDEYGGLGEPHYWLEPPEEAAPRVEREEAIAAAARPGFCGAAGVPVVLT